MSNLFTKEQIDEIASRLVIKSNQCVLIYLNLVLIILIFYILYKYREVLKIYKKNINDLNNKLINIEKKITNDNFTSPDEDTRYLVERSQKGVSNKNLLETSGLDFYTNKYIEDSRLLNALNDL
jgi:16S rRNA G527 N7-methylase RsmG